MTTHSHIPGTDDICAPRRKGRKRKNEFEDEESEQKRVLANSQERVRMQKINTALEELRSCLPAQFHLYHRRMSKIRTLRLAMNYIRTLSEVIQEDNIRRQEAYRHTLEQLHAAHDSTLVMTQDSTPSHTAFQSPTAIIPYYPYLGPLCGGVSHKESLYQTPPVQTPPRHMINRRMLNFGIMQKQEIASMSLHDTIIAGSVDTPVKRHHGRPIFKRKSETHRVAKSETFTSPFLGQRNSNELDISFLSSGSDTARDDIDEGRSRQALETAQSICTLEDIIEDRNSCPGNHHPLDEV